MKLSFKQFMEAAPPTPPGGMGTPAALPGGPPMGGGMPPMPPLPPPSGGLGGGPPMGGMPPMGGSPQPQQQAVSIKPVNVWNAFEELLYGKKPEPKVEQPQKPQMQMPPQQFPSGSMNLPSPLMK